MRELGNDIAMTASAIDRTEHRLLSLLRVFDSGEGWRPDGATSGAFLSERLAMAWFG